MVKRWQKDIKAWGNRIDMADPMGFSTLARLCKWSVSWGIDGTGLLPSWGYGVAGVSPGQGDMHAMVSIRALGARDLSSNLSSPI